MAYHGRSWFILSRLFTPMATGCKRFVLRIGIGKGKRQVAGCADHAIIIASPDGARVQESHTLILHLWLELIEAALE